MGFERVVSIIQGTDEFHRILTHDLQLRHGRFPPDLRRDRKAQRPALRIHPARRGHDRRERPAAHDIAFRVIADHLRTLSFAIADGIQPGNNERDYVLRRILRRAVRYGRTLGFKEPFFYQLVPVLVEHDGRRVPRTAPRSRTGSSQTIKTEEESFNRTLDNGIALFRERKPASCPRAARSAAAFAFRLYDEQGFPLDLTEVMAREAGLTVDRGGLRPTHGAAASAMARAAQKKEIITADTIDPPRRT